MGWLPAGIGNRKEHVLGNDLNSKIIAKNMFFCVCATASYTPFEVSSLSSEKSSPSVANCLQLSLKAWKMLRQLRPKLPWTQHAGLARWFLRKDNELTSKCFYGVRLAFCFDASNSRDEELWPKCCSAWERFCYEHPSKNLALEKRRLKRESTQGESNRPKLAFSTQLFFGRNVVWFPPRITQL